MMHRSVAYIYAPYMLFSSIAITYGVIIEGAVVPSNGIHYHYHIRREYIHVFLHITYAHYCYRNLNEFAFHQELQLEREKNEIKFMVLKSEINHWEQKSVSLSKELGKMRSLEIPITIPFQLSTHSIPILNDIWTTNTQYTFIHIYIHLLA